MNNENKAYLKNNIVELTSKSDKKIYIKSGKNKTGREVATILNNHKSELTGGNPWKKVNKGASYEDFTLFFDKKEHADTFKSNIEEILGSEVLYITPSGTDGELSNVGSDSSSSILLVLAGVVVLFAIGIVIWKKRK